MKRIILLSLASALSILNGVGIAQAQNGDNRSQGLQKPDLLDVTIEGDKKTPSSQGLKQDRCNADFKLCSDISESANTIKYVYKNGRSEETAQKEAVDKLTARGACSSDNSRCANDSHWDSGYAAENIHFIDEQRYMDDGKPVVDVQAIIAEKTFYEGDKSKGAKIQKKFFITIRGTEGSIDEDTDKRAALRSIPISPGSKAEVPLGFYESAEALKSTKAYKDLIVAIKSASANNEDFEVLVTGHSLGGATATAIKASIDNELSNAGKKRVQAITFGSPPAGNKDFEAMYGDRVSAIHIEGDPISSMGNGIFTTRIGTQYTFKMPDKQAALGRQFDSIWYSDIFKKKEAFDALKDEAIYGTHAAGYNDDRYGAVQSSGWNDLRISIMQNNLTAITSGGSSHIGSAAYYLGHSPAQDKIDGLDRASKVQQFSGSRTPSIQQREEYTTPGSTTNLTAPVDIVLDWNQSVAKGQLDLDSHLTGPTSLGANSAVRFHTRFDDKGSITTAPYVQLYKDVIPTAGGEGPEQTRIQVLQNGVYRFYVHDFTNRDVSVGSTALANSEANVNVYNLGKDLPQPGQNLGTPIGGQINVPTDGRGNVWYVFQLDSRTGILKRVFAPFGNESDRARVPRIGEPSP